MGAIPVPRISSVSATRTRARWANPLVGFKKVTNTFQRVPYSESPQIYGKQVTPIHAHTTDANLTKFDYNYV